MILPLEVGGEPFEGVALIAIGVRAFSIWRNWRKWSFGPLEWFFSAASIVFLVFLGLRNIEVVKPWILVSVVLSLVTFVGLVASAQLFAAFAVVVLMVAYMVAYFIIGADFDSGVWVIFGATVFGSSSFFANLLWSTRASRRFVFFSEMSRKIERTLETSQRLRRARVEELEQELKKLGDATDARGLRKFNELLQEKLEAKRVFLEGELKLAKYRYAVNAAKRGRGDRAAEAIRSANEEAYSY